MLTVNELFAGIGSQRAALERLGIEHKVVGIAEIDKFAIKSYEAIWGPTKNYGDIGKVKKLDYADFWTYSFPCFTKYNYVLTDKGYKTIDKIETGDRVLTHNNTYEKVLNTFNNGIRDTVKIKGQCIDEIVTTKNHKFYVREKYRRWNKERRSYDRVFKDPEWLEIDKVTKDYYLGVAINQRSIIPKWGGIDLEWSDGRKTRHKNELQPLMTDKRFWWLTGRYIADGWTRTQSGIVIAIGKHKLDEFIANIGDIFNYNIVEERTSYKCHIPLKELEKFVLQFGKGAINKKITNTIIDLPVDLLESFLEGYISGDGYYNKKDSRYKCSSISRELLIGLGQCVAKVYKTPFSLYKTNRPKKTKIEGRIVNQQDSYELTFKKDVRKQDNAFYEDGYIWYPFQSIEENGKEEVFDIEVENAHSFTVQNTIVHNCQDISVAGKQAGIEHGKTRSGLLYEVERLLEKSRECDELPKYLMLENVKNLVGKKFKAQFEEWIKRLDELGYNTYWQVLNAKNYGIPQNRERVFGISIRKDIDTGYAFPEPFELKIRLKDVLEKEVDEKFYINNDRMNVLLKNLEVSKVKKDTPNVNQIGNCVESKGSFKNPQRGRVYSENGCSPALNCVGGGGLEPKILQVGNVNPSGKGMNGNVFDQDGLSPTITTNKGEGLKILEPTGIDKSVNNPRVIESANCITSREDRGISNRKSEGTAVIEPILFGGMQKNQAVKTDGISTCLTSSMGTGGGYVPMVTEPIIAASRGRNPNNPSDRTPGSPTEQRLEINQNGTSNTITTVQKDNYVIEPSNLKHTELPCIYDDRDKGFGTKTSDVCPTQRANRYGIKCIEKDYRIRKLTPKECWRLMGFRDEQFYRAAYGHDIPVEYVEKLHNRTLTKKEYRAYHRLTRKQEVSNSQLYKQAGNSIVVDVLYYLFKNLFIDRPTEKTEPESKLPRQMSIMDYL